MTVAVESIPIYFRGRGGGERWSRRRKGSSEGASSPVCGSGADLGNFFGNFTYKSVHFDSFLRRLSIFFGEGAKDNFAPVFFIDALSPQGWTPVLSGGNI